MPPRPELASRAVDVSGTPRRYLVAVPAGPATGIVLCLHGRGMNAKTAAWFTGMDRLAEDLGAAVVFPQGSVRVDRSGFTWDHDDDLSYVTAVADAARGEFGADRVCVCGISAGARMASFFAAARAEDVGALGAVAGLRAPHRPPSRPVPVLAFHGLEDRALPYTGGPGSRWSEVMIRRQNRRAGRPAGWPGALRWKESVPEAARAWASANGVEGQRTERRISSTLARTSYGEGGPGEVTLFTFANAGHTWPGRPAGPLIRTVLGRTSTELDATDEIWRFFRRQS